MSQEKVMSMTLHLFVALHCQIGSLQVRYCAGYGRIVHFWRFFSKRYGFAIGCLLFLVHLQLE